MFDEFAKFRREALAHADQFRRYASESGMKTLAKRIEEFQHTLGKTRYNIAVVGNMKRGKSTLLNALLGRTNDDVSPIDEKVCTAGIVQYIDTGDLDAKERGIVFYEDRPDGDEISPRQVRDYVTEDRNPGNRKKVRQVEVYGYFPLLNESVSLIDTPGCGSVNKHHETLVEQFLPNADAIIFPIDSGNPIDASEQQFLELLSEKEKDRIFFVLTKYDSLDPEDRDEVETFVREKISSAGLSCDRLHKVSARDVFEARKTGRSEADVEAIANESGVANLECELEMFILNTSERNEFVRRRIADVLQECNTFCRTELDRLDGEIKSFDLDVVQLEAELNEARKAAVTLRSERDRALKTFEKKWNRRIARFDKDLIRNSDRICDAIVDRLRDRGFVKTLADSTKLGSEVARRVDNEISATVADLDDDLSSVVSELHDDLDEQLDIYRKRCKLSNVPTSIVAASGGAVVAGAGFVGLTSVTSAFATASSAWAAVGTASATSTMAAGKVGFIQGCWAWLVGTGGAASSTGGAASAAAAQTAATSAAIGATVTTIATVGGALAAVYITKTIAHWGVAAVQENRVPALVESALEESGKQVVSTLEKRRDAIVDEYRDVVEGLVECQEERIEQIIEAINANDPAEKERRLERKERLGVFLNGNNRLEVKMAELPKLSMSRP